MRLKYFLFGSLVTIMILIVVNILVLLNNKDVIYVKGIEGFDTKLSSIDKRIEKIKNQECRLEFVKISDNIKKTYFRENTTVDKYYHAYFDDEIFLNIYKSVLDKCSIKENDERYYLVLASYSYPNSIKTRYNLRHEIKLKDKSVRDLMNRETDEIGSHTTKILELRVIDELLEDMKK